MAKQFVLVESHDGCRLKRWRISMYNTSRGWRRRDVGDGLYVTVKSARKLDAAARWWIVLAHDLEEAYGAVYRATEGMVNLRRRRWLVGTGKVLAHGGAK